MKGDILHYRADATRITGRPQPGLVPAAEGEAMIELRMAPGDFARLRLVSSPLSEAINSLYMLHTGRVHALHRRWAETARERLRDLDTTLLRAIVPPAGFVLTPPIDLNGANTIEHQLQLLADWQPGLLRAELESLWHGRPMPAAARQVIADGPAGSRRVAVALGTYWNAAIAPHWDKMRAALDADIAYRAQQVTLGGISALLKDLHPQLQFRQSTIRIDKPGHRNYDLEGNGLLLIPCVFAGSCLMFDPGSLGVPSMNYRPRGLGTVWDTNGTTPGAGDPLTALIGSSRTAILRNAELPRTTTDLARELSLSGATISVHLSILKRCGMVTSWRSGSRVLYQRTPLASSILSAVIQTGS
jgi:DNA-binding transcriptional ArsR family regulator